MSAWGREQQISTLPAAGGSIGSGRYKTAPAISAVSQLWQTPVRHEKRVDFRDGHAFGPLHDPHDLVSGPDLSLFENPKIEARPAVRDEQRGPFAAHSCECRPGSR